MSWKNILPPEIKINKLSFAECKAFKGYYELLTKKLSGPKGFNIFYPIKHHLLFYAMCCIQEQRFPALNNCWNELWQFFKKAKLDNEWLMHCWILCDFPIDNKNNLTMLDYFYEFVVNNQFMENIHIEHINSFVKIMKASRLGLYQEILSTSKTTKFKELFTNKVISTIRSVPYYESGEIFLGRIINCFGDSFLMHDPVNYPSIYKDTVTDMVKNKLFYISESESEIKDYEKFMKLAGPYWISATLGHEDDVIFSPDHYLSYYNE